MNRIRIVHTFDMGEWYVLQIRRWWFPIWIEKLSSLVHRTDAGFVACVNKARSLGFSHIEYMGEDVSHVATFPKILSGDAD